MPTKNIFFLLFWVIPMSAKGQAFVSVNMRAGVVYKTVIKTHEHTGTLKCNPFGKGEVHRTSNHTVGPVYNSNGNGRYESAFNVSFPVKADMGWRNFYHGRTFHVAGNFMPGSSEKSQVLTISIRDDLSAPASFTHEGECSQEQIHADASRTVTSGNIQVGYKLGPNEWGFIIRKRRFDGDLPMANLNFAGSTNVQDLPASKMTDESIVLGTPGTDVYQDISLSYDSPGRALSGTFVIEIAPLLSQKESQMAFTDWNNSFKSLLGKAATGELQQGEALNYVKLALLPVQNPEQRKNYLNKMGAGEVLNFTRKLQEVAGTVAKYPYAWDVKASSYLLGFALAKDTLVEIAPYCQPGTLYLPYLGKNVETLKLKISYYFLKKSFNVLSSRSYDSVESFLEQWDSYGKQKVTYAQLKANSKEFEKLLAARDILINTGALNKHTFTEPESQINYLITQTKDADTTPMKNLSAELRELGEMEGQFLVRFVDRLNQFGNESTDIINVSDLRKTIKDIKIRHIAVTDKLEKSAKSFDLKENLGAQTFTRSISHLVTSYVNTTTITDSQSQFPKIRQSLADYHGSSIAELKGQVLSCTDKELQ